MPTSRIHLSFILSQFVLIFSSLVNALPLPDLRATWINVWVNSNQTYVPSPDGRAANGIECAWDLALLKYNITLPKGMGLSNTQAVDWIGGQGFGNMFTMISLIQKAGINVLIPDFTNGFSNSNSRFPVQLLHQMLAQHFPTMKIAYAVSAASFVPAQQYLFNPASDISNYLYEENSGRPVLVAYCTYMDFEKLEANHPNLSMIFADGESTRANKGGWHTPPFTGPSTLSKRVFWVAPSLDWQSGTNSTSWSISLAWFLYGFTILKTMSAAPWMLVVGSFDDCNERNMWLPAVTSKAISHEFFMTGLDGSRDSGKASINSSDWTIFYDLVTSILTKNYDPDKFSRIFSRVPTSAGELALGTFKSTPSFTIYTNPPVPFNRGVFEGSGIALMRSVHPSFPSSDHLFPLPSEGKWLQQFYLLSHNDQNVVSPLQPLHFLNCTQCGHLVCDGDDHISLVLWRKNFAVFRTSTMDLKYPSDLSYVNYALSLDLSDCNLLGPGISFLTGNSVAQSVVAVLKTYPTQSFVYFIKVGDQVIIHALSTGLVYAASKDFSIVECVPLSQSTSGNYLWRILDHPISGRMLSIRSPDGTTLVWTISVDSAICPDDPYDCVYRIVLSDFAHSSMLSSFDFA